MESVGAKHSWQGVTIITAAVKKNASPLVEYRSEGGMEELKVWNWSNTNVNNCTIKLIIKL